MLVFKNKIKNSIIEKLRGEDKLLHSKYGNIFFCVAFVLSYFKHSFLHALFMAMLGLLIVGFVKELYDKYMKKSFIDWWDIVASFVPYPLIKYIQKL